MKYLNWNNIIPAICAVVSALFFSGCASKGEFGDRTAVVIYNQKPIKILDTTTKVFASRGYRTLTSDAEKAVYERPGTTFQNAAYSSWMGGRVWEKATVTVEPYAQGAHLLAVDVELLQNKDDDFFRDEKKMSKRARKPFQEMLDEVSSILSGVPMVNDEN